MLRDRVAIHLQRIWELSHEERTGSFVLLESFSNVYGAIQRMRRGLYRAGLLRQRPLPCAVVSVGALRVGGAGKTPFALWLSRRLAETGWRPAVLSRGYRRHSSEGTQILLHDHIEALDPLQTGDEPYLLAKSLPGVPVVVDANRFRGAWAALDRHKVNVFVLDDGFQHLRLARDCDVVLIGSELERPKPLCLPAGPLREPPDALQDAQVLVRFSGSGQGQEVGVGRAHEDSIPLPDVPLLRARLRPAGVFTLDGRGPLDDGRFRREAVFAFCGVGRPEMFWLTLQQMNIAVAHRESFPDHHSYRPEDFRRILSQLGPSQCAVTTEKDAVKIARFPWPAERVFYVRVTIEMEEEERFWQILSPKLRRNQGREMSKCG